MYLQLQQPHRSHLQLIVIVADQMPEQKVYDFITGLVKMFNLVIEPTSRTKFLVEPLDDWYALGTNHDITQYTDTTSLKVTKPELYKRISLKYQESDTYEMRNHRLTNGGVGYGDIRADFTFDGGELTAQNAFEIMRYQKLDDLSNGITNFLVGKSIDKEGRPLHRGTSYLLLTCHTKHHNLPYWVFR